MGVRRAAVRGAGPHAGGDNLNASQAIRFREMLEAGEAELSQVLGVAWWWDWTWRKCVRRSGDATTADSGLIGLVVRGEITLDELDQIGATVVAVTDDAGLWIECERAGHLGGGRFT